MRLDGRVALVTGGSGGIGGAVCRALAEAGADVAVHYGTNRQGAEEVAGAVRALGRRALVVPGDVSRREEAEALVEGVLAEWGRLEVLVNNAGITRDGLLLRMKDEDWDQVMATNLSAMFYTCRAAARAMMKQRHGRIINVSSVVALSGNAGQANYVAAKAGVIGFTRSIARELASRGITANAVAPGYIATAMTEGAPEAVRRRLEALAEQIPAGRLGRPADVAGAVVFLASDAAAYVTGQTLVVDGGLVMH